MALESARLGIESRMAIEAEFLTRFRLLEESVKPGVLKRPPGVHIPVAFGATRPLLSLFRVKLVDLGFVTDARHRQPPPHGRVLSGLDVLAPTFADGAKSKIAYLSRAVWAT